VDAALALCRVVHIAAVMLLFGVAIFQWGIAPRALARDLDPRLRPAATAAAFVALVSAFCWFALQASEMGDGWGDALNPDLLWSVLRDTSFGQVWMPRLCLCAAVAVFCLVSRQGRWWMVGLLGAMLLGSLGLVGHAVIGDGRLGSLLEPAYVVHLLAAGFWVGCLLPVLACLGRLRTENLRTEALHALRRFSGLGHFAVALVIATGLVNARIILGGWPTDRVSLYRALLLSKIGVVFVMIALAIVNRYVLSPRLLRSPRALAALRTNTVAELILGIAAVALVGIFGMLPPE
jgi:putative copper resistance protein D